MNPAFNIFGPGRAKVFDGCRVRVTDGQIVFHFVDVLLVPALRAACSRMRASDSETLGHMNTSTVPCKTRCIP